MRNAHGARCTSVVKPSREPPLPHGIVINAIDTVFGPGLLVLFVSRTISDKLDGNIPFILMPGIFLPPISGTSPRPGCRDNFTAHTLHADSHRLFFSQLNHYRQRPPENTETSQSLARFGQSIFFRAVFGALPRYKKPGHSKILSAMRIEQFRRSHVVLAHQLG